MENEIDYNNLDNEEIIELLTTLESMDEFLENEEKTIKEEIENENK